MYKNLKIPQLFLISLIVTLGIHQFGVTISRWLAMEMYVYDVGQFDYMLTLSWHGQFFHSVARDCNHFALHFTPTLVLLIPLRAIFRHILFLPLLEVLSLWSAVWATAAIFSAVLFRGRSPLGKKPQRFSPLGLALGVLFFCNPLVGSLLLSDHIESFFVALSLWALAAILHRRYKWFFLFFILSIGIKEDIAIYWAAFGLWWVVWGGRIDNSLPNASRQKFSRGHFFKKRIAFGFGIFAFSTLWFLIAIVCIHFIEKSTDAGVGASEYIDRYFDIGKDPKEIFDNLSKSIVWWINPIIEQAIIILPAFVFLPLLAPEVLLLILPGLYLMGWSSLDSMFQLFYYYSYPHLPWLTLAAALGLARLLSFTRFLSRKLSAGPFKRSLQKNMPVLLTLILLVYSAYSFYQPTRVEGKKRELAQVTNRHQYIRRELRRLLPPDASVCLQYDLFCQATPGPKIYPLIEHVAMKNLKRSTYWVFDTHGFAGDMPGKDMRKLITHANQLVKEGNAEQLIQFDGFMIFKLKATIEPSH